MDEPVGLQTNSGYCYLTMTAGPRVGTNFLLDPTDHNRIGRGETCDIILTDPLCSRIHAEVTQELDGWWVRDAGSRNGTHVNGHKQEEWRLAEGVVIRVGSTEFVFHRSDQPPTSGAKKRDTRITETIVKEAIIDSRQPDARLMTAFKNADFGQELLVLYQLSLRLLGSKDPDEAVESALNLLIERSKASVVGFLWVNDEGELKPKIVLPKESKRVTLSKSLTEVVCEQGRAVWVAHQSAEATKSLKHYSDALCVPLIFEQRTVGAIHVYLNQGQFRQRDFDFTISLASLLAVALVKARHQATLEAEHKRLVDSSAGFSDLIGECTGMVELKSKVRKIAQASGSVLVRGESGSGKELVARALHQASPRHDRPMLSVNCAAIPADLMESQLFGHSKGAFTNADRDHRGWFQQADSGTLFLDEIGEMTLSGQAKLLRILEGHPFQPVGSTKDITVDVRVIAATNRDLREFVKEKKFREDLFYRLSVFELEVPPLRDREGDIDLLIEHFLSHFRKQHGRTELTLSTAAKQRLVSYAWPGNVRQLRNVIDSAVVMSEGPEITPGDFGLHEAPPADDTLRLDEWEKRLIRRAIDRTNGSVPEAAKLLGIGRATLYRKLEEYDIER